MLAIRRVISLVLALAMFMGMVPLGMVEAQEIDSPEETFSEKNVEETMIIKPDSTKENIAIGEVSLETETMPQETVEEPLMEVLEKEEPDWDEHTVITSGAHGDNLAWKYQDGILTITGNGEMAFARDYPWYHLQDSIIKVIFDSGVTSIADYSFQNYEYLTEVVIPEGMITIGDGAFENCAVLKVEIPSSTTVIGKLAFHECESLYEIIVSEDNPAFASIDGVLFDKKIHRLITYPIGKSDLLYGWYEIPTGVIEIAEYAFEGCDADLTSVIIPEGVTTIGTGAFQGCDCLLNVTIPDTVVNMGCGPFWGCGRLWSAGPIGSGCSIEFGWTDNIPAYAFEGTDGLRSVTITEGISSIGEAAFRYCKRLEQVEIPDTVQVIGDYAFADNEYVLTSISLGDGVTDIGAYAFSNCKKLENIQLSEGLRNIGECAFSKCEELCAINLPKSLVSLGDGAFWYCKSLQELSIPESVKTIGESAFDSCTGITAIFFNAVSADDYDAFYDAFDSVGSDSGKVILTIGNNVTRIPGRLFRDMEYLQEVIFEEDSKCIEMGTYAFSGCKNLTTIAIPSCVLNWGHYAFWVCSKLSSAGPVGSGCNIEFGWTESIPKDAFCGSSICSIIIPDSITAIENNAFHLCNNLTEVTLPPKLTNIGDGAFNRCSSLSKITLPDSIQSVGESVFEECPELAEVILSKNLKEIRNRTFYNCRNLRKIILPDSIQNIGESSFEKCTELNEVILSENLKEIGTRAFFSCINLSKVIFPDSVQNIGENAFCGCSALTDLKLPPNINTIKEGAFRGCSGIKHLQLPTNLIAVDQYAFSGCDALETVSIPNGTQRIDYDAFNCQNLKKVFIPKSVIYLHEFAFGNHNGQIGSWPYYIELHYSGNKKEWEELTGKEYNKETDSKVVFGTGGAGSDPSDDPSDDPGETGSLGVVRFFRKWDSDKQIAYWGEREPAFGKSDIGSQVTEKTDISFLANVSNLVGKYVLVKTASKEEVYSSTDVLISIKPVITKTGIVTDRNGDTDITIDGTVYKLNTEEMWFAHAKDLIMYHLYNNQIVSIKILDDRSGLDADEPDKDDDYLEFDYDAPVPEKTNEQKLLKIYAQNWQAKYDDYIEALRKKVDEIAGTEEAIRGAVIKAEADRMMREDRSGKDKYVTFADKNCPYKTEAYTALATLLYDEQPDDFDFAESEIGAELINELMTNMYGSSETYTYGNVSVSIHIYRMGSSEFGSLTCTNTKNRKSFDAIICSTQKEVKETVKSFCSELKNLGKEAGYNVYLAIVQDLFAVPLSSLTSQYIMETVHITEDKYLVDLTDEFMDMGVGKVIETLQNCWRYFTKLANPIENGNTNNLSKALEEVEDIAFNEAVDCRPVRRKLKKLQEATEKLNELVSQYNAGTLKVSDWQLAWESTFKCPVNVAVYNSSGEQIGYVGDDEIWYDDSIIIINNNGAKTVYSLTHELLSFKITATDSGTMCCTFEEYNEDGKPLGRLNFYDIVLSPGQEFTTALADDLLANSQIMSVKTGNTAILANEYISSKDSASVNITCTTESNDGITGGVVGGDGVYIRGDGVVLHAIPDDGYSFSGWYADDVLLSGDDVFEFTATKDIAVTAKFIADVYVYVDVQAENNGTVEGEKQYLYGDTALITAAPEAGTEFIGWYVKNQLISTDREYQFTVTEDTNFVAKFSCIDHTYNTPDYMWSEDKTRCVASFACANCGAEYTVECIVSKEEVPATDTRPGETVYTATAEFSGKTYTDTRIEVIDVPDESNVTRIAGSGRVQTALESAKQLKTLLGVDKFQSIVVADARNFPDALSGSYLAAAAKAPILLYADGQTAVTDYVKENLASGGTVYILGGTNSVSSKLTDALPGITCERVAGSGRFGTSLDIIRKGDEILGNHADKLLVCIGASFADSLSASATGLPILLVNGTDDTIRDDHKAYLETLSDVNIYVIGGTNTVNDTMLNLFSAYDADGTVDRVSGSGRAKTSVEVAKTFFPEARTATLALSTNFPDGLSGGPVAYTLGAPLLLISDGQEAAAAGYVFERGIKTGYIFGGISSVSDTTANTVFGK